MIQALTVPGNEELLYRAITRTVGGRADGKSRSADGNLEVRFAFPGPRRSGTNPEQLLAAAWSACFESTMGFVASRREIAMPEHVLIDTEIDLNLGREGFFLGARLDVELPGMTRETASALVEEAYRECPFSKAMRGNVDISINLILAGVRRAAMDHLSGPSEKTFLFAS